MLSQGSDSGNMISLWPVAIILKEQALNSANFGVLFFALRQILTFLLNIFGRCVIPDVACFWWYERRIARNCAD